MRINILGSTCPDFVLDKQEVLRFAGLVASVSRSANVLNFKEPNEKTMQRVQKCIAYEHFSILEHITFNLYLDGIPKILAMIINNEKAYSTTERSFRYTKVLLNTPDSQLYQKWLPIFQAQISKVYPEIPASQAELLAQENARYLISVFAPTTSMVYTVNFRQLCYIIGWMRQYVVSPSADSFSLKVKEVLKKFLNTRILDTDVCFNELAISNVTQPHRSLSLFASIKRHDEFGENYCITYPASFAYLAQAQRHRTIKYEFAWWKKTHHYFTPPIIVRDEDLSSEWQNDIKSLKTFYPQGMLIDINERGSLDDFILKCMERLCGHAQIEIVRRTKNTLDYFSRLFEKTKPDLYLRLAPYINGPRCTFPGYECKNPCMWKGKHALKRIV